MVRRAFTQEMGLIWVLWGREQGQVREKVFWLVVGGWGGGRLESLGVRSRGHRERETIIS